MADILISKFTTQIPRVGATPATPGFAESEGQDPVAPSGTPIQYGIGAGLSLDSLNRIQLGSEDYTGNRTIGVNEWQDSLSGNYAELVISEDKDNPFANSYFYYFKADNGNGIFANARQNSYQALLDNTTYQDISGTYSTINLQATNPDSQGISLKIRVSDYAGEFGNNYAVFQDNINNKGVEYASDYELNFTARSLVTKQYVDGAISGAGHSPVTIGTPANGLSISGTQVLSIVLASTSATGALSSTDWNTFNNKLNLTSPITGYTVGANTALAATDSILQAFGKVQGQINARVSGSGVDGQVAFWSGATAQSGSNNLFWDSVNGRLGIGTNSPASSVDVITESSVDALTITNFQTGSVIPAVISRKARGTRSVPVAVTVDDGLGGIFANGYNGTGFSSLNAGAIIIRASQTFNATDQGTYIQFANTPNGSTTRTERLRIFQSGNILIQNGGTYIDSGNRLDVNGTLRASGFFTILDPSPIVSGDSSASMSIGAQVNSLQVGQGGRIFFATPSNTSGGVFNNTYIGAFKESASGSDTSASLVFGTRQNGGLNTERLRITSTGQVWISTTSGTNTLDVNGTARIRTISNLGTAATSVLVPSATGVVSLRTLAELASDMGNAWISVGSGNIYRNSRISVGHTGDPVESIDLGTAGWLRTSNGASAVGGVLFPNGANAASRSWAIGSDLGGSFGSLCIRRSDTQLGSAKTGSVSLVIDNLGSIGVNGTPFSFGSFTYLDVYGRSTSVSGVLRLLTSNSSQGFQGYVSGSTFISQTIGAIPWTFGVNSGEQFRITAGGNILFGTTTDLGFKHYFAGTTAFQGLVTFQENVETNIAFGTTTGTKIGTATNQKLGFWNATPIVQPTTSVASGTLVSNAGTTLTSTDTIDGYTLQQVVRALRNTGLLA